MICGPHKGRRFSVGKKKTSLAPQTFSCTVCYVNPSLALPTQRLLYPFRVPQRLSSRLLYQPSRLLYPFRVPQRLANGCFTNPRGCYPFRVHARLSSQLLYRIYWGGVPRRACAPRPAGGLTPCAHSLLPSFTNPRGCFTNPRGCFTPLGFPNV